MKRKNMCPFYESIKQLIPDIKPGDYVSLYNPGSYIIGCNWIQGFIGVDNKFIAYSYNIYPAFRSSINGVKACDRVFIIRGNDVVND